MYTLPLSRWLPLVLFVFLSPVRPGHAQVIPLTAGAPDARGWIPLNSPGRSNWVHVIEASPDLVAWHDAAVVHQGPFSFTDVTAPTNATRFFRLQSRVRTAADDGKNQIVLPNDPFANEPENPYTLGDPQVRWIKFAILREDETRVWFQDSAKYPFHHDFARLRLPVFQGISRPEFDQRTLYRSNQLAVLGAVLIGPAASGGEFGIQIVGQDAFDREEVARWIDLVRAGVGAAPGSRSFYVPTFEQAAVAESNRDWFATQGITVGTADRWLTQDARYSEGWAVGRLVFIPASQIAAAYVDGRLRATDILLTDAVPAEIPYVAGIITLTPATPNSHVAILARGFGVPFVWFSDPELRAFLPTLSGREVALRTGDYWSDVRVLDIEGQLGADLRQALQALKIPAPLNYPPKQRLGQYATNVQPLVPADARYVGGKAANYGLLLRTIPANTEPAIAFSLDLWDDFLDQTIVEGGTLRAAIHSRLGAYTYPPDFASLRAHLETVRERIAGTARFPEALRAVVLGALTNAGFDSARKIRFRSSTNVEDSEDFTGAGLYDSFSGCLLDDLDNDSVGPSACDPDENNERGVFRAIQRVYASFYNENAFLERLRRGVKEEEVGMALLVHHSFPDIDELANGVATLRYETSFGTPSANGDLVTQLGAESVSNPDSSARPEVVTLWSAGSSLGLTRTQSSSLVPLGDHVMVWEADYQNLSRLFLRVAAGYAKMFPGKNPFTLDFEYKRMRPGTLDVKQVRPLPQPKTAAPVNTFLLNEPMEWQVLEGEYGEPMAKHRAKSKLRLQTDVRRLNASGVTNPITEADEFHFRAGTQSVVMTNGPTGWPDAAFSRDGDTLVDRWSWGSGTERRTFALRTTVIRTTTPPQAPWVTQRDFSHQLSVDYATPQPSFDWEGPGMTTRDEVFLVPRQTTNNVSLLQYRAATNSSRSLRLFTRFHWPEPPRGPTAGYTAPNIGFVESSIEGLTLTPVVLRDPAAQTYSPGHHNFSETFIFEPRLDAGVPAGQIADLEARGVRQLVVELGLDGQPQFGAFDAQGTFRELK